MIITADDALPVFLEVARVQETLNAYVLQPNVVPISLDDLEHAISEEYHATIEKKTLPFKSDLVRSLIRIYEPREQGKKLFAQTVIDSELNSAQTRYNQAKELAHVLLYHRENCTDDPTSIIAYFVREGTPLNGAGADIKNESLADLAAYEILFPRELRDGAIQRILRGDDTIFTVADWLDIPEHVVETILDAPYSTFSEAVWRMVEERAARVEEMTKG